MKKNILNVPRNECCGCSLCEKICSLNLIQMISDKEGFLYPQISDYSRCTNCGMCYESCTTRKKNLPNKVERLSYKYFYVKNENILVKSASGALAYYLSKKCIQDGFFVCGVRYNNNYYSAHYEMTNNEKEIDFFRGSKYIQANKQNIYNDVCIKLNSGNNVFFVGLPCEVSALLQLLKYKKIDCSNLITCDLICHGPTSELIQKNYIKKIEQNKKSKILNFNTRYKNPNWKPYYIYAEFEDGSVFKTIFSKSDLGVAFQFFKRPSCYLCRFKKGITASDFTIGDFHAASKQFQEYNEKGVSICMINTEKGKSFLNKNIVNDCIYKETLSKRANRNIALLKTCPKPIFRQLFFNKMNKYDLSVACRMLYIKFLLMKKKLIKKIHSCLYKLM